jgi:hypothetical protein
MPWLRIDDGMWRNRKLLDVSPVGKALWTWCLGYSADQLTDGVLARADMRQIAAAVGLDDWQGPMQELVDADLVERDGDTWLMHDYLDYNPSREQVLKERDAAAQRQATWKASKRHDNAPEDSTANAVSNAVSNGVSKPSPFPSRPVPVINDDDDKASAPEMDKEFGAIWSLYVSEFLVNPASIVSQDAVGDLVKMSRDPTIHREAIKRARKGAASNRPSLRYIEAILESYLNTGSWEKPGGNGHKPPGKGRSASRETDYSKIQASAPVEPYVPMTPEEKATRERELAAMGLL